MQFAIFISSLIAATIALPIPQAGVSYPLINFANETWRSLTIYPRRQVGSADVLSGYTGGTDRLLPGSTHNVLDEGGSPVNGLSKSGSGLVERSPGAGVSMFNPIHRLLLIIIAGWHWRCAIRGCGWHQHSDDWRRQ